MVGKAKGNDGQWTFLCLQEYEVLERVFDPPKEFPKKIYFEEPNSTGLKSGVRSQFSVGNKVAVWCESEDQPTPSTDKTHKLGWRRATVIGIREIDEDYPKERLLHGEDMIQVYMFSIKQVLIYG